MTNLIEKINVATQDIEPCLKELEYTIPAEAVAAETNVVVKEFAQYAELPGFRKGKVPAKLVKKRFADKIEEELLNRFLSTAFEKTVKDGMDIVTYALAGEEPPVIADGKDVAFKIRYDVAPEIELPEYVGLELEKPANEVAEEDVQKQIDYYKEAYAEYKAVEGAAEAGDMLKVSYTSDFEVAEDASQTVKNQVESAENWVWLNEPETLPGAIEALTGAEAGKEYEVASTYADDYREAELAGKTVNYKVTVAEVQRRAPIESDEALCEKMNLENFDALLEQIKTSLEAEVEQKNLADLRSSVVEKLCEAVAEFPLPPSSLEGEVSKQLQVVAHAAEEGVEVSEEDQKAEATEKANDRLRRFFISRAIAAKEDIKVEPQEIQEQIAMLSRYYGYPEDQLRQMLERTGGMNDIQVDLLVGKVADFVVEKAKVS